MRQPLQGDLIQRRLFTVHFHAYASGDYVKRRGQPRTLEELDDHRILTFGGAIPSYLADSQWLQRAGRDAKEPRASGLVVNNLAALKRAVESGIGIGVLPDYLIAPNAGMVQLLPETNLPSLDSYFVYPEEMKNVARVQVFRDFLVAQAQRWTY